MLATIPGNQRMTSHTLQILAANVHPVRYTHMREHSVGTVLTVHVCTHIMRTHTGAHCTSDTPHVHLHWVHLRSPLLCASPCMIATLKHSNTQHFIYCHTHGIRPLHTSSTLTQAHNHSQPFLIYYNKELEQYISYMRTMSECHPTSHDVSRASILGLPPQVMHAEQ